MKSSLVLTEKLKETKYFETDLFFNHVLLSQHFLVFELLLVEAFPCVLVIVEAYPCVLVAV